MKFYASSHKNGGVFANAIREIAIPNDWAEVTCPSARAALVVQMRQRLQDLGTYLPILRG